MTAREDLLAEIDSFLSSTGMSESYFGQIAVGNSKLLRRLRDGRSIRIETADRVREFIRERMAREAVPCVVDPCQSHRRSSRAPDLGTPAGAERASAPALSGEGV